jgi:hypothetical protein
MRSLPPEHKNGERRGQDYFVGGGKMHKHTGRTKPSARQVKNDIATSSLGMGEIENL